MEVHVSAPDIDSSDHDTIVALGAKPHNLPLQRTGRGMAQDVRYFVALRRLIREIAPDRVLNYTIKPNIWGSLAARFEKVQTVSMITGLGYVFAPGCGAIERLVKWLARRLYGFAVSTNRAILFQNPDDVDDFEAAGLLRNREKVKLINGSGVDLDHYAPAPLPAQPVFLMIARLLKAKGVREYASACSQVRASRPQVRCLLVGVIDEGPDGVSVEEVRRLSAGAIEFIGQLQDVRPALASANVYVLPSYREGTPRSSLEAMAMGRAVITTDAPGCRETVVDGHNGLLVPVGDVVALTEAMIILADDHGRREVMGARSLEIARSRFAVDKVNDAIIGFLGLD